MDSGKVARWHGMADLSSKRFPFGARDGHGCGKDIGVHVAPVLVV